MIRLIELFAGIGSQASALDRLGLEYESHRISEWEINAVASYKAIHCNDDTDYSKDLSSDEIPKSYNFFVISSDGKNPILNIERRDDAWKRTVYNNFKATNNIGSIVNASAEDLGIVDTDRYTYLLTYSFPCQDLSVAGLRQGMSKGSGTRSGLLWEVERLLNACKELPQLLLMENVPQVHSKQNMADFEKWISFLESKGYKNYWDDLNAKDYGVAQSRNRTFMVSMLDGQYHFPHKMPLTKRMKDYLEDTVDERYYINTKKAQMLIEKLIANGEITNVETLSMRNMSTKEKDADCDKIDVANALMARDYKGMNNFGFNGVMECKKYGSLAPNSNQRCAVYDKEKLSPTLMQAMGTGGGQMPYVIDDCEPISTDGKKLNVAKTILSGYERTNMTGFNKDNAVIEEPRLIGGIGEKKSNNGKQYYQQHRVYDSNGIAMAHPSQMPGGSYNYIDKQYRIRKLTPKECWRLMGFTDEEFEKAEKVNSNTQLYKQAGNSIVVDVLVAIFKNIFITKEKEYAYEEQISLFDFLEA